MTSLRHAAIAAATVLFCGCATSPDRAAPAPAEPVMVTQAEKAAMSSEEKADVYNESASDEDRVYCRKQTITGSHRKKTVCRTVAESKKEAEAARDALWGARKGGASDPGGGGN